MSVMREIARDFAIYEGKSPLEHAVVVTRFFSPIERVFHLFDSCEGAREQYERRFNPKQGWLWRSRLECRH